MPPTTEPSPRPRRSGRSADAEGADRRDAPWLDAEEMAAWLPLVRVLHVLPQQLDRQLREQAGINHHYYMIMVALSAQPDRAMTLSALAREVAMIPSRLTHALSSLQSRGWVERRPCETDRRVQFAWLTDEGRRALERAAPGHVAEVRRTVFDLLDRADLAELSRLMATIAAGLDD